MATPRKKRAGSRGTAAVGAQAPAAVASPTRTRTPNFRDDQTAADLEDGMALDDGSDLMVRGDAAVAGSHVDVARGSNALVGEDASEDGLIEETGSSFAWSVPDSTPRLRRAAPAFETTTSTAAQVPGLEVVATDPPATVLRPSAAHAPTATGAPETRVVAIRKHRSGATVASHAAPAIATQISTVDGEAASPEFMRPRMGADAADRDRESFGQRRQFEGVDPLTQRLGCRWFVDAARFEWCREGPFNLNPMSELDSRPRYVFTRWYQLDRIIVDVFRGDNDRVRHEIAEKIAAIRAQAIVEGQPIGYLPCVRGAFVPDDVIAAVKRGEIAPFQLAQMRHDVEIAV